MSEPEAEPSQPRAAKRLKMSAHSNQSETTSGTDADDSTADVLELPTLPKMSSDSTTSQQVSILHGTSSFAAGTEDSVENNATAGADAVAPDSHANSNAKAKKGWPALQIPVEIFDMIIEHLSRRDVQNMRLVNHEFDAKLAGSYFKVVVVPFRPEFEALYGSLNINPGRKGYQQKLSLVLKGKKVEAENMTDEGQQNLSNTTDEDASLLSDGYRVFEQFGASCMRKFALALELNEKDLAFPPLKVNQEIVMAPWGLYRWPIMRYQRYHQLENLEQMADETGFMKKAFAFLEKVSHIGISCDAGLGWLQGPDTNPFCTRIRPPVFRPVSRRADEDDDNAATEQEDNASLSLTILRQMALNAGYNSNEWPSVILRLLEDEGRAVQWREHVSADGKITHERVPTFQVDDDTRKEDIIRHIEDLIDGEGSEIQFPNTRGIGLQPVGLTTAQVEMLLELEWAHRALMQSYRTAVLDNRLSFKNLTHLTIARCPSCHVSIWCDRSFWSSMTSIKSFHLGVIPGWHEVVKDSHGYVVQRRISPLEAVKEVFALLQGYVGNQNNIKDISFEWVNGGEFAVGKSQRDRYILPAPVLIDPEKMVDMQPFSRHDVVSLPYVSKLSLKNCWFSPHVFYNFTKSLFLDNLSDLVLESVSLTGTPSVSPAPSITSNTQKQNHWPWPLCVGAEPGKWFMLHSPNFVNNANPIPVWLAHFQNAAALNALGNFPINLANAAAQQLGNQGPIAVNTTTLAEHAIAASQHDNRWRTWSWPYILASLGVLPEYFHDEDEISAANMPEYHATRSLAKPFSSDFREVLRGRERGDLPRTIKLKSCGYALVEATNIDNWKIIPDQPVFVDHDTELPSRLRELDSQMLTSDQGLLGKILHHMPSDEEQVLQTIFGLRFGWDRVYGPMLIRAALADGVPEPGRARFYGNLSTQPRRRSISTRSQGKQVARP